MNRLLRYLLGYVRFVYSGGFAEGFINACYGAQLPVSDLLKDNECLYGLCGIKTYKKLHRLALSTGGKVKVIEKCGLPFFLAPLKKRWGFFTGMALFAVIISVLTGFIWNVEITGNNRITTAQLQSYLEKNGVSVGERWADADRKKLSYAMLSDFDDIAWAHINKIGTTARLEIDEATAPPTEKTETEKAQGTIIRREIVLTVSRKASDPVLTGQNEYKSLYFYGVKIPFYFSKKSGVSSVVKEPLKINGRELPIYIETDTEKYYIKNEYSLSDKELEALARKQLKEARDSRFDGMEVVNENVTVKMGSSDCEITGAYILRTD